MPTIDLAFTLVGRTIPLDHGYSLFSAISKIVPSVHGNERVGLHPIAGLRTSPGSLQLTERSILRLRLPSEEIAPYIALSGCSIELEGHRLRIGIPRVESLRGVANLAARLVTIRGALTPDRLEQRVRQELSRLEVSGEPSFVPSDRPPWTGQPKRRVMRIKDKRIVGFAVRISGLTPEESIRLQEHGLGGRRRMGCGVFLPRRSDAEHFPGQRTN
jgi:CRISPR-associated protein Cas6